MIILLDLNYTLVENSLEKASPFFRQIDGERYRRWLVKMVKHMRVILITARPEKYREQTLKSIGKKTNWQPEAAFFNKHRIPPPPCKHRIMISEVFPRWTDNPAEYLAIESNPRTRAMYAKLGVQSIFVGIGGGLEKCQTQ